MAIFYTDSGSFNDLKVTGSAFISASRGVALQLRSSGSTIFSVSGSSGEIFNISDAGSSTALFTVASSSVNILNVDITKNVSVSGSLLVTGSAYFRDLVTSSTVVTNVVMYGTNGQLFTTASTAIGGGTSGGPINLISTGSVTASVNVSGDVFKLTSGSSTFIYVNNSGSIGLGSVPTYSLDLNLGGSKSVRLQTNAGNNSFIGAAFGSTLISNNVYYINPNWTYEKTATACLLQLGNEGVINISTYESQSAGSGLPGAPATLIRLSNKGYVGINTFSPTYSLDISGSLNVSNIIYLSGSAGSSGQYLTSQGEAPPIWTTPSVGYTQLLQIINQTGVVAPTVDHEVNTTSTTYTWTYNGSGDYTLTANTGAPFTAGKTSVILSPGYTVGVFGTPYIVHYEIIDTSTISIFSETPDGTPRNDIFSQATIDIKIFP